VMGIPEDGLQVLSILRLQQTSVPELIKWGANLNALNGTQQNGGIFTLKALIQWNGNNWNSCNVKYVTFSLKTP
jgi:hypothetical protein